MHFISNHHRTRNTFKNTPNTLFTTYAYHHNAVTLHKKCNYVLSLGMSKNTLVALTQVLKKTFPGHKKGDVVIDDTM